MFIPKKSLSYSLFIDAPFISLVFLDLEHLDSEYSAPEFLFACIGCAQVTN